MFIRNRISAWICLLSLPAFAAAASFPGKALLGKRSAAPEVPAFPAAQANPALTKADVNGFWSLDLQAGLDLGATFETYFTADGSFESRGLVKQDGLTQTVNLLGTWKIRNDTIVVKPDPNRCIVKGDSLLAGDCTDTSSTLFTIETQGNLRILFDVTDGDQTELGEFVGTQKQFTIPDLFSSSILGRLSDRKTESQRFLAYGSGRGIADRADAGMFFDVMGRLPARRTAAGIRVNAVEKR